MFAIKMLLTIPTVFFMMFLTRGPIDQQEETPQGPEKLDLDRIETDNFLNNPVAKTPQGDALIVKTSDYQIAYLKQFNEFIISISTSSAQVRSVAEAAFLEKLEITEQEACRLNVSVSAPFVNVEQSTNKRLSFC